jgi:hypothetical protein
MSDDVPKQVRIRTDPDEGYEHRYETIQDAADAWGCNKTRAVLLSCELATFVLDDLEELLADERVPPEVTRDLVDRLERTRYLSTSYTGPSLDIRESGSGEGADTR